MPIGGIESVIYGVEDLHQSTVFYDDFGLRLESHVDGESVFRLDEGTRVILRRIDDPSLPAPYFKGSGVRETVFWIDSVDELAAVEADLKRDREVRRDADGSLHFHSDCGIPLGLRVFQRKKVLYSPDPVNAPDNVKRLNQHRRWRTRARPKTFNHIVFRVDDHEKSWAFFRDRLGFRLSDTSEGAGIFGRPAAVNQHHVIFLMKLSSLPYSGMGTGFDHLCFGVEDIDEVFAGWNYMERRGWKGPLEGVGRHRIASAIYCYFDSPCGGSAEYGADTDYVDDNWIPRIWSAPFGGFLWTSRVLPFMPQEVEWTYRFDPRYVPDGSVPEKHKPAAAPQEPKP